ncbi:hypothetical protein [Pseudoxanthomonas suwonensis]|uniref:hypothetical protein n=1 Tax=Pseudoxanthomonas suwonensis TaxID=314722 RepID=UPI000A87C364|nr:hypothetical protein [Pseudoxanthomonas suwonensis]
MDQAFPQAIRTIGTHFAGIGERNGTHRRSEHAEGANVPAFGQASGLVDPGKCNRAIVLGLRLHPMITPGLTAGAEQKHQYSRQ